MADVHRWGAWLLASVLVLLPAAVRAEGAEASTTLTPQQVREDFELALAAVEAGMPDIAWFQSKRAWRRARREAREALVGVVDAEGLFRVLRPLLSRIGEGHLVLRRSPAMVARDRQAQGLFPLDLHWTHDGVWVQAGWGEASDIVPGTRLLAVDGEPVDTLVHELMAALGHDGRIATGAMREAGGGGYAKVRYWMRGGADRFHVRLQDRSGGVSERWVAGIAASVRNPAAVAAPADASGEASTDPSMDVSAEGPSALARLEWIDGHTAHLIVPSFSNRRYREAGRDYAREIREIFETLHARRARHLILDLRGNGGGSEGNENLLFSYLVREPMRKYAAVVARGRHLSVVDRGGRRYEVEVFDEEEMRQQRRLPGGALARRNRPPEGLMSHWESRSPVFEGRLLVLAGGETFSGGAELASMLFHARRALFVGEEVGGAHAGNTSGYSWDIELPHSGLTLEVPLLQFRFAWRGLPHGRGVLPHCPVAPDLPGSGADSALRVAVALISRPWTMASPPRCPAETKLDAASAGFAR